MEEDVEGGDEAIGSQRNYIKTEEEECEEEEEY